jgi:DNA polymerase-3 subunit beta
MIFNRLELLGAIDGVSPSLCAKGTIAALKYVKLRVSGGIVTVEAENLRSRTAISFGAEGEDAAFLLPPKLREILRKTPEKSVDISEKGGKITVRAGRSNISMTTIDLSEYPEPSVDSEPLVWMESDAVLSAITRAQICASRKDEFPKYISGVLVETESGKLSCVSTDGRRMALVEADLLGAADGKAVLPVAEIGALRSLDASAPVKVSLGAALVTLAQERVSVAIRRLDANFPPYRKLLSDEYDQRLTVDTDAFRSAIDRASIISRDDTRAVSLSIGGDQVRIEARSPDMGEAMEIIEAETEGEVTVGFNSAYLMDGLNIVESNTTTLHLRGSGGQVVIRDGDMRYILMPFMLGGDGE